MQKLLFLLNEVLRVKQAWESCLFHVRLSSVSESFLLPWQQQLNTSEVSSQMSPELRVTSSDQSHAVSSPAGAKTQPQLPPQARQASNRAAHSSKGQATCAHRRKECLYISLPSTPRLFLREYPGKGLTSQHRTMRQQHHPATQIPLRWGQKRGESIPASISEESSWVAPIWIRTWQFFICQLQSVVHWSLKEPCAPPDSNQWNLCANL